MSVISSAENTDHRGSYKTRHSCFSKELQRSQSTPMLFPCCQFLSALVYLSRSTISSAWNRNLGYNHVWAAGFWGNEKAEEQLASVIGLLASSHRAWLTCLWSIPGTFAQRTKTQQIMMIRNFWISNSCWQTRCSNVSDIRLWCELIDTVCPFKVRLSSKSQTGLKRKW